MNRLKKVPPEMRMAGAAALVLVLSLLLPWYSRPFASGDTVIRANLSAFGVFSFVEASILLVAAGVLFLIWARSEDKAFHLPGGDGVVFLAAGTWSAVLLIWRVFDRPGDGVGIQWGFVVAFGAAAALIAAGARVRAAHRPEPPNPAEDLDWEPAAPRPRRRAEDREPREATAVTEVLRDPPKWEGDDPTPPGEEPPPRDRGGDPPPPRDSDRLF